MRQILQHRVNGVLFIPNAYYASPFSSLDNDLEEFFPNDKESDVLDKSPRIEKLRAYHAYLDKLDDAVSGFTPDMDN